MNNLAELLLARAAQAPGHRIGMIDGPMALGDAVGHAAAAAAVLRSSGLGTGDRVAVVGTNSNDYVVAWMALQLGGQEAALVNPTYPDDLLAEMLLDLRPAAVLWVGPEPNAGVAPGAVHVDGRGFASLAPAPLDDLPGCDRRPEDVAGYMHTSGTTGPPKFCAQTHAYFLAMGRFVADGLTLGPDDVVFAPLPLFHVNPMGYGFVGGLVAGAEALSATRFSARRFWTDVAAAGVTTLVLHAPPVEILKRSSASPPAHRVRSMFFADGEFLERFGVPVGVSAYGSTEAGGVTHLRTWRRGDRSDGVHGMSRTGGRARPDIEWRVDADGEIGVRGRHPHVLADGYLKAGELVPLVEEDGWFATGDVGTVTAAGDLVFIERRAESIRVKGEYVPIGFVEDRFAAVPGVRDVAVWRTAADLVDHEVVLYVVADGLDLDALGVVAAGLPAFMRPQVVALVAAIPRDDGVGKVRRRHLDDVVVIDRALTAWQHSL